MDAPLDDQVDVVYVSPLKALSNDIGRNLETPLAELETLAAGRGMPAPGVRTAVRTGDTSAWERERMVRRPPHILVTTPESLYILLTARRSRDALRRTSTVIVDEIHALVDDKRGSHLALTLARLDDLVIKAGGARLQRIGLSATVRPIADVAAFLHGSDPTGRSPIDVVDSGHRRQLDLAVEVPRDELGVVATNEMWSEIYDRLAALVQAHRTTLVFVNTRRLCERVAHHLTERLGDEAVLGASWQSVAALAADRRVAAQDGTAAGGGRHRLARARHRHRHRGSGVSDRVAPLARSAVTLPAGRPVGPSRRHARRSPCAEGTALRHDARRADRVRRARSRHPPGSARPAGDTRLAGRHPRTAAGGGLRV